MTAAPDESPSEETLTRRELSHRSDEVLREVEAGASYVITDDGRPVARLVPVDRPRPLRRISRPATRRGGFTLPTLTSDVPTADILDELRADRM